MLPAVLVDLRIELRTGLDDASWIVSGYLLAYALGMAAAGRLSDVAGRQRVLLAALAMFFLGSWWVATSTELPAQWAASVRHLFGAAPDHGIAVLNALGAGRIVQGSAAGALVPTVMALAADLFPPSARTFPLGVVAGVDMSGWVLGHVYGGLMVQRLPWQAIFWVNLPLTVIAIVLVAVALKRTAAPAASGGIDLASVGWLALALFALNSGLAANESPPEGGLLAADRAPAYGPPLVVAGIACGAVFLWRELRSTRPLLPMGALALGSSRAAALASLLAGFCLMVGLVSVPLLVNAVGARSAQEGALASGYLLACFTIPLGLAALAGGALGAARDVRPLVSAGLLAAIAGFVLWSRTSAADAALAVDWIAGRTAAAYPAAFLGSLGLAGIGLGLTVAPLTRLVLDAAPETERGRAAALVLTLRLVGMMAAVSILTTYGLRRISALGPDAYRGVALDDTAAIVAATRDLISRVTSEMTLIAAAVCVLTLLVALRAAPGGDR